MSHLEYAAVLQASTGLGVETNLGALWNAKFVGDLYHGAAIHVLYINQGGRCVCKDHGGMSLKAEAEADPNANMIDTPRDNWLAFRFKAENLHLSCEECGIGFLGAPICQLQVFTSQQLQDLKAAGFTVTLNPKTVDADLIIENESLFHEIGNHNFGQEIPCHYSAGELVLNGLDFSVSASLVTGDVVENVKAAVTKMYRED